MKVVFTFLALTFVISAAVLAKGKVKVERDSEGQKTFVFSGDVEATKFLAEGDSVVKTQKPSRKYFLQIDVEGDENSKIPQVDVYVNKFWLARLSSPKKETREITEFLKVGDNQIFFMVSQNNNQKANVRHGSDAKVRIKIGAALALKLSKTDSDPAIVDFSYDGSQRGNFSRSYDIIVK